MCFGILAGHQDVVNVSENEVQTLTDDVHQALEGLGSILQAEGHSDEFIESKRGDDSGLGNVYNSHGDLVVASDQIDLRENPHTS